MLASASWRCNSSPLILGNRMSRTRQLVTSGLLVCRNSWPEPNSSTCNPTDSTRRWIARESDGSSSTTKTTEGGSVMKKPLLLGGQSELKKRSLGNRLSPQTAPMGLYDRPAD